MRSRGEASTPRAVTHGDAVQVIARWLAAQQEVRRARQERVVVSFDSRGGITAIKVEPAAVRLL